MLTRDELDAHLNEYREAARDFGDGEVVLDIATIEECLAPVFAQAAQAAELAAEGAALRECLQSWAEALCKGAPWMKGEDAERIKALLADVISSPSPLAAAYQAAMALAKADLGVADAEEAFCAHNAGCPTDIPDCLDCCDLANAENDAMGKREAERKAVRAALAEAMKGEADADEQG